MISVLLDGRLGNQMFQYAFAFSLAKRHNCGFECHSSSGHKFLLSKYFILPNHNKSRFRYTIEHLCKKLLKYTDSKKRYYKNWQVISQWDIPNEKNINLSRSTKFLGYFQSNKYFDNYKKDICNEFCIKKKYKTEFSQKYSELLKNPYATVHVRRSDYLTFGNESLGGKNLTLPISYYNECLKKINDYDGKIVFISDDIEFCKKQFGLRKNFLFESNQLIIDFQLILNSQIAIISNSTFSWWAAYLNKSTQVYAPKYWLGFKIKKEYPSGICYSGFNWINVD